MRGVIIALPLYLSESSSKFNINRPISIEFERVVSSLVELALRKVNPLTAFSAITKLSNTQLPVSSIRAPFYPFLYKVKRENVDAKDGLAAHGSSALLLTRVGRHGYVLVAKVKSMNPDSAFECATLSQTLPNR